MKRLRRVSGILVELLREIFDERHMPGFWGGASSSRLAMPHTCANASRRTLASHLLLREI